MGQSKFINGLLKGILTSLILLNLISTASATTVVMVNDEDLIVSSRAIIHGKVLNTETKFDEEYQRVYTYVTVKVQKVFKGEITSQEIVLRQMGGQVGDIYQKIYGAPEFNLGEEVLLYLNAANDGALHVAHLFMGKFTIHRNSKGKAYVDRVINDVRQLGTEDELGITNKMELNSYLTKIEDTVVNFSYRVDEFNKVNRGKLLRNSPQEYSISNSSTRKIQPKYSFLGSGYRWFEPDTGAAVTYYINTTNAPISGGGITEFDAALSAWSNISGCSLRLQDGGVNTSKCGFVNDGTSIISFNDCRGEINDPVGCGGVLAIGGISSASYQTKTVGGKTFNRIIEGDVVFNNNFTCFLGNSANLAEVMTHEIGHSIGAGHSTDSSATMSPSAHGDGRGASLRSDDMAFAVFTYPGSSTPSPAELKITNFSPTSGPVGTSVTIAGSGFSNGGVTAVNFGSTSATSVTVNSDTQLTVVVPADATTGKISLIGKNKTVISTGTFTVIPIPTLTNFSPSSGIIGTQVLITGTALSRVTSLRFGSISASFTLKSDTQISAIVPTAASTGKISLISSNRTITSTNSFIVTKAPKITSFTPNRGRVGTLVTIVGTELSTVTRITFNGVSATISYPSTGTSIQVAVPSQATTGKISITNPAGTATSSATFTVTK